MASPDRSRNHTKRDLDTRSDGKNDRARDDEERKAGDKRRHRSSKSRKISNQEDSERLEGSERKRKSGDRNENRRRSGGSTRGDSDEDDIDAKKELRSKQTKKSKEESSLEKLSSWYRDGELENKQDGVDKLGTRSHGRGDESERRKMSSKFSDHESSQRRSKNKEARLCNGEHDKSADRDSKFSERRESNVEKGHNLSEQARHHKRRWDEPENRKTEDDPRERSELRSGKPSDAKRDSAREKSMSVSERTRGLHSNDHKVVKSSNKEGRKVDSERHKSRGRSEPPEEGYKTSPRTREDRSGKENSDRHRRQRTPIKRDVETRERFLHTEADASMIAKERSGKGVRKSSRSRTPERSGRRCLDSEAPEMNYEKSINAKRKEPEKDAYRDDRSVGRDDKDFWKRRQSVSNNKEAKDGEIVFERGKEWEFQRLSRERNDHGRSGGRKDATRSEAVKTSSNFGISNENYDVIEIQTKPIDYGRPEQGSSFARRRDVGMSSAPYDEERAHAREDRGRTEMHGSGLSCDDSKERYMDGNVQDERRRGQKDAISTRAMNSPLPSYGNLDQSPYNRVHPQGAKGAKVGKGVRARPAGRDSQQVGMPLPLMGSPFGPLGMPPPGPMQSLTTSMSPAPGPPISLNMFIPPFSPPVWPGSRGMDMNMLPIPPGLSPFPPGLPGLRFSPNMAAPPNPAMYFNQLGSGRGAPPNASGPGFNTSGPAGPHERSGGGWMPPRSGLHGKAPSRGEQNDYSQNFVDTGMRPQNFIRELELTNVVEDYPKLRELIQKKDEIVAKSASPPMYFKCDLKEFALSPEFFGTKFDVILIDPPWEEYVHRAPGVADHMDYWTPEEILNLKIEAIADTPSFIFLWVGDGMGLEQGRHCLKKWGYRRCEDICWVKTNKANAAPGLRHDSHTLFQHSKEHCLMGIKGTVRRSTDGHIIHANIDTDVLIAEEPPYGSTSKPEDMYRIVEHFALGRRRLELFGEDHNIRSGWLTVGKGLSSSNFNAEAYVRNFAGKDGKVWQGGGGRNPPPETPHLVLTTPDIESLRPKSPMKNQHQQQQQQHQSASISVMADKRSPPKQPNASSSTPPTPAPWIPPAEGFKGSGRNFIREGRGFEMHAYTTPYMHGNGEFLDVESHRTMPMNIF